MAWMPRHWNLPGGHVDAGETFTQAAIREVFEETRLRVHDLVLFTRVQHNGYTIETYYATLWTGRVQLNTEHTHYAWITRERAYEADLIPPQADVLQQLLRRPL